MKASKDEWHTLDILIALARINHIMHNDTLEMEFLAKAKEIAERIKSTEHLADIHSLYYTHAKELVITNWPWLRTNWLRRCRIA